MSKRILSLLCAVALVLGMITVPAFAAEEANNGSKVTVLSENAENLTFEGDSYMDLNGHSVAGVTVTDGTLYVSDSQTDDYTVADGVYGKVTGITGTVQAANGYLQVSQEGAVSFHRVNLKLSGMALRPGNVGVYYTSLFAGDEVVAQQVESFGVALSVAAEPNAENMDTLCAYSTFTGFVGGKTGNQTANGTLLSGIMKPTNTEAKNKWYSGMDVYGRAYIKTADGYIFGDCVARNLMEQVEAIDTVWATLTTVQKSNLLAMYGTYQGVMTQWNVPNMKNAFENPGTEQPDDDAVIVMPIPVSVESGKVTQATTVSGNGFSVTVPAGVQLVTDETELTLVVTLKNKTDSGVTLEENQVLLPLDVHVDGVSVHNTVPLTINLGKQLPENLNLGNYGAYHVENGNANEMTLLPMEAQFTAHNQYKYTLDGEIILHIASFSEIALTANTENVWNGGVATAFGGGAGTDAEPYLIRNADQLAYLNKLISADDKNYNAKNYKLLSDIDFGGAENVQKKGNVWYPIGYWHQGEGKNAAGEDTWYTYGGAFMGTFDGNGHKIANIHQNTWSLDGNYDNGYWDEAMGLFGYVYDGTVKNLTMERFCSEGEFTPTGCVAAYAVNSTFENIALVDCNPCVYNTGNGGIVGIGGNSNDPETYKLTFNNITIDNTNKITALWGSWDVACGGLIGMFRGAGHVYMNNCHVAAQIDVYNDVCGNYQYYWYRYSGMLVGTNKNMVTVEGKVYPETSKYHAENCTVHFGEWNNYYYCELVANSLASYTHDHQFSRLTEIAALTDIADVDAEGNVTAWKSTGNYVLFTDSTRDTKTAQCFHIVKDGENLKQHLHEDAGTEEVNGETVLKENNQIIYLPFNQLFTGYGWGVNHIPVYNGEDYAFEGVTILDRVVADSDVKFSSLIKENTEFVTGTTVTIGDLFKANSDTEVAIVPNNVQVTVSPATDESTAAGTYEASTVMLENDVIDWTKGTLTFSGTGEAIITITDYYFCTPTTIKVTVNSADKFDSKPVDARDAYTQITLGELFNVLEGVTLVDDVTATVTDPDGKATTVTTTATEWASKTIDLTKAGNWKVAIKDGNENCVIKETSFTVNVADKFINKFDKDFLYRVGNLNAFDLGYIFGEKETALSLSAVNVTVENIAGNATGIYTSNANWTSGDIRFTGTGVVKVTISAESAETKVLYLEVVEATNITSATGTTTGGDLVLLQDVNAVSYVNYWSCTLYGNGFTYSLNKAPTTYESKQGHGILIVKNATLDNLVIIGDIYPEYGAYTNQTYYNAAIDATNAIIQNCYVANCATPIRANGVKLVDTTLYGGTVANIIISGGTNVLENTTTVNYNDDRDVFGLGVLVSDSAADTTKIVLDGALKQYNFVCEDDISEVSGEEAQSIFTSIFADTFASYHVGNNPKYVNTGIIIMSEKFNTEIITDNAKTGYLRDDDAEITITSYGIPKDVEGAVYTMPGDGAVVDNAYSFENDPHTEKVQGDYLPKPDFDLGDQEQMKDNEDDTNYLIGDIDGVNAMFVKGETPITLDLSKLMTVSKYEGVSYPVTAKCVNPDGTVQTGTATLSTKGTYTLVFSVNDNVFYNQNGVAIEKSVTRTYEVPLVLDIYEKTIADATITVNSTDCTGTWSGYSGNWVHNIYPLGAISSVMDDANKDGTLETFEFKKNISSVVLSPASNNAWSSPTTITITYKEGQVLTLVLGTINPSICSSPGTNNGGKTLTANTDSSNGIKITSDGKVNSKCNGTWTITSWSFKGTSQKTVSNSQAVNFVFSSGSSGGNTDCLAAGTMITMADGSKKAVENIRKGDVVMAFDHVTGNVTTNDVIIVVKIECDYTKNTFIFDDGTQLATINEHGIFDLDLNKYVNIDEFNYEQFLGHRYVSVDSNGNIGVKKLVAVETVYEHGYKYDIVTNQTLNYVAEDTLSVTHVLVDVINTFDFGEGLTYDQNKMQEDIATYGLYTYDEWAQYCDISVFEQYNIPVMKVGISKGLYTQEYIVYLINRYVLNDDVQVAE